jgi:hypothetical protein
MEGRSIEKLKEILGHYSVVMTEVYAHLKPDLFKDNDYDAFTIDLTPGDGEVSELRQNSGRTPKKGSPK